LTDHEPPTPDSPRCPRCDAPLAPEQDWCLECGTAVTTRVVPPPGWRLPLIVGLAVLALLGVGVAVAVSSMSGDADRAASAPGSATGAPASTSTARPARRMPAVTAVAPPTRTVRTTPTTTTPTTTETVPGAAEAKGAGPIPVWPAKTQAYTVVVPSNDGRRGADKEARRQIARGNRAGILKTDRFDFFTPGSWVVWVGRYPDRPAAEAKLKKLAAAASGAYVTLIRPRGGG
jgi:hypothetical protein